MQEEKNTKRFQEQHQDLSDTSKHRRLHQSRARSHEREQHSSRSRRRSRSRSRSPLSPQRGSFKRKGKWDEKPSAPLVSQVQCI